MNQRDRSIVDSYHRSNKTNLWQCYESFSHKKQQAWEYCEKLRSEYAEKYITTELRILGANGYMFSAGFEYCKDGKWYLMYITKSQDRSIYIDEEV